MQVLYVTKVKDRQVANHFGWNWPVGGLYLGVAAIEVVVVFQTHAGASAHFGPRTYVSAPQPTPYPPNIAIDPNPVAAVAPQGCIVYDANKRAHTPPQDPRGAVYAYNYNQYLLRQQNRALRVAACRFVRLGGNEALCLDPAVAPHFTQADIGGRHNVHGKQLPPAQWNQLATAIAAVGLPHP